MMRIRGYSTQEVVGTCDPEDTVEVWWWQVLWPDGTLHRTTVVWEWAVEVANRAFGSSEYEYRLRRSQENES